MHLKWPVLMCALAATAFAASTVKVVEEIVAKVNGDIITLTDLERSPRIATAPDIGAYQFK